MWTAPNWILDTLGPCQLSLFEFDGFYHPHDYVVSELSYLKKDICVTVFFGNPLFKDSKKNHGKFMGNAPFPWSSCMEEAFLLTAWQVWQTLLSGQTGTPLTRILLKSSHKTRRMPAGSTPIEELVNWWLRFLMS